MNSARRAIFAGFWGGLLAGLLDGIATLLASPGMLDGAQRFHLIAIDSGLGALAGAGLAVVFVGWTLAMQRQPARSRRLSAAHAVALLLALPVVAYDSFALFHGTQASSVPGHRLISVFLIIIASVVIWAAVTLWCRLLGRVEPGDGGVVPSGRAKILNLGIGIGLVFVALVAGSTNRHVLPRLYHWFHLTLTLLSLLSCVLAVRLLLGLGRRILGKRWSWILAATALVALVAGGLVERSVLTHSQSLRYFIYEKTQLASLFVTPVALAQVARTPPGNCRGGASAAPFAHGATSAGGGCCADHHRCLAGGSSGLLRLCAPHIAQHRCPGRARGALRAHLRAGAAHFFLTSLGDDWQVLPHAGTPRAVGYTRNPRSGGPALRLEDGGVFSARGVLCRRAQDEGLRIEQLRFRIREVRIHERRRPHPADRGLSARGTSRQIVLVAAPVRAS